MARLPKGISAMPTHFRVSSLVRGGLIVDNVEHIEDSIIVTARAGILMAMCPLCSSPSRRVCRDDHCNPARCKVDGSDA
jgi:hypothetical protein